MERTVRWSDENIYALIKRLRNDVIEMCLKGTFDNLEKLNIDHGKLNEAKNTLMQYRMSPINSNHYKRITEEIKKTDTASFINIDMNLIYEDLRVNCLMPQSLT